MLSDGNQPLSGPMLTQWLKTKVNSQRFRLASVKIVLLKLLPHLPGASELAYISKGTILQYLTLKFWSRLLFKPHLNYIMEPNSTRPSDTATITKLDVSFGYQATIDWVQTLEIGWRHYNDVIMSTIASQITSLTIVHSTVYSDADQSKHQSSASLAFVQGIHRGPVNFPHRWPVTRKMFPFDDVIIVIKNLKQARYILRYPPLSWTYWFRIPTAVLGN